VAFPLAIPIDSAMIDDRVATQYAGALTSTSQISSDNDVREKCTIMHVLVPYIGPEPPFNEYHISQNTIILYKVFSSIGCCQPSQCWVQLENGIKK